MKNISKMLLAASLMTVTGFAFAHSQAGSLVATQAAQAAVPKKGTTPAKPAVPAKALAATDLYKVTCYDAGDGTGAPAKLYVHVKTSAVAAAAKITIQALKGGASISSTDAVNTDAVFSTGVYLIKGAGDYVMSVSRPAAAKWPGTGISNYVAEFHCQSASGAHAGTDWTMTQNQ